MMLFLLPKMPMPNSRAFGIECRWEHSKMVTKCPKMPKITPRSAL